MQYVKEEYNASIKELMRVKGELNLKKEEVEAIQVELGRMKADIVESEDAAANTTKILNEKSKELEKLNDDLKRARSDYDTLIQKTVEEEQTLAVIITQQSEIQTELEETTAKLHNARVELASHEESQKTSASTAEEGELAGEASDDKTTKVGTAVDTQNEAESHARTSDNSTHTEPRSYASVIEAASAVVASLKSKLSTVQNELDESKTMLDRERQMHEETKRQLESLKQRRPDGTK